MYAEHFNDISIPPKADAELKFNKRKPDEEFADLDLHRTDRLKHSLPAKIRKPHFLSKNKSATEDPKLKATNRFFRRCGSRIDRLEVDHTKWRI